jgi:hypothetical protein
VIKVKYSWSSYFCKPNCKDFRANEPDCAVCTEFCCINLAVRCTVCSEFALYTVHRLIMYHPDRTVWTVFYSITPVCTVCTDIRCIILTVQHVQSSTVSFWLYWVMLFRLFRKVQYILLYILRSIFVPDIDKYLERVWTICINLSKTHILDMHQILPK